MKSELLSIAPVLPSSNIERDVAWYREKAGFETVFCDNRYAAIRREQIWIHLQWHADTEDDPLLGGSVVRIFARGLHNAPQTVSQFTPELRSCYRYYHSHVRVSHR